MFSEPAARAPRAQSTGSHYIYAGSGTTGYGEAETNRAQSVEREIIEDFRTDAAEESIDQSEHGRGEEGAVTGHPAVPGGRHRQPRAAARGHARRPRRPRPTHHQAIMIPAGLSYTNKAVHRTNVEIGMLHYECLTISNSMFKNIYESVNWYSIGCYREFHGHHTLKVHFDSLVCKL